MTREQAALLIRDVDALPKRLGKGDFYNNYGRPCCAVGHLAHKHAESYSREISWFRSRYGVSPGLIMDANDSAPIKERKAAVVYASEVIVRYEGFDPDDLRREAVEA